MVQKNEMMLTWRHKKCDTPIIANTKHKGPFFCPLCNEGVELKDAIQNQNFYHENIEFWRNLNHV